MAQEKEQWDLNKGYPPMVVGVPSESHPMEEWNIGALQREHPPFHLSLILKYCLRKCLHEHYHFCYCTLRCISDGYGHYFSKDYTNIYIPAVSLLLFHTLVGTGSISGR